MSMRPLTILACLAALGLCGPVCTSDEKDDASKVDEELAEYEKQDGIDGTVVCVTSDTLSNLMTLWAEGFRKHYPKVQLNVEGKGATTPPAAMREGVIDIGGMSRPYKDSEIEEFKRKYGYEPSHVTVAFDALALFVHKDNPVHKLSLAQVDAIYSSTRKRESPEDSTKWGQVGLDGDWADLDITLFGRNSMSSTYGYFKERVLSKGDFKKSVKEQPGSAAVVKLTSEDRGAIGYSGIGARTDDVRAVPISLETAGEAFEPTRENCYSEKYPISRRLYIYFNRKPSENLKPRVREFLKFVHSRQGQEVVLKDGFIPLTINLIDAEVERYEDTK